MVDVFHVQADMSHTGSVIPDKLQTATIQVEHLGK
jgi:hypothetical protein